MSRLQELISELCLNRVEYRSLEELGVFLSGLTGKSKADFKDGNAKFISYLNVFTNMKLELKTDDIVKISANEKQNSLELGDVVFTASSEIPEEAGMSSVVVGKPEEKIFLNSFCFIFRIEDKSIFDEAFLAHLFRSSEVRKQIIRTAQGVTRFNISKKRLAKIKIPIPPLAIQKEIGRILDSFTELTAELTSELKARKKQYEYYNNKLLVFDGGAELYELGEILVKTRGTSITARKMEELHKDEGLVRIFAGGKTYAEVNFDDIPENDINRNPSIIVKSRGNIEFEYYDKPFSHKNEFWSYYSDNERINIKYVYYYLSNNIDYFQRIANNMQMPQISIPVTDRYKIPVPPLSEQERIVSILDKFDDLVNDISIGLPAEIEARKKQYEYYRDKLLTFKEKE